MTHTNSSCRRNRKALFSFPAGAWILALASGMLASTFGQALAATYLLGPLDVLKIRVFEWRPSAGIAYEWVPLTGEFTVSASGTLSLPIVGTIPVAGKTPEEVSEIIGEQLQAQIGLQKRPNASIEISSYRPFFVTGAVGTPGKFNFLPGLTVTQALSMAGGSGSVDPRVMEVQREALVNQGTMRELEAERLGLIARQARVDAMLAKNSKINFPRELTERSSQTAVMQVMRNEQALLDSRLRSMDSDLTALEQSKVLAKNQIEGLKQKEASLTKQIDLANKDLSSVNKLVSQGLTVSSRQLGANQNLADLESRNLDVSLALLTTQQDLTKLDQDALAVVEKFKASALMEASELRDKLAANDEKMRTSQALLLNIEMRVPAALSALNAEGRPRTITKISRTINGAAETFVVKDDDPVQPGDVIRVEPQQNAVTQNGSASQ
ncbi:exopolysaccharide production protein ExoF [Rhizobium wenxiniae]|uniref:Polysaccharide export outer membrane protein n=1 Tax=Rhizobium wenxiniae TaxID=1737357 RepID=A0A7W9Y5N8_9HYPH|nr:polysaccharide biosynthesis/export family protein [Rhizobium wenxiniae]MBB6162452.1 polysaccharide export outer membrane protein [Rhizobium wenxiniae]GGF98520.1 exopolysaccharide production protein ExoF [Rhizobium wenxiniae]